MNLFPEQSEALAAIVAALEAGQNRQLLKMPTGTGKTVTFAELLKVLASWLAQFQRRGAPMLVIAHREELLDQAADKIRRQNPGLMVDIEQGERRSSRYADVIIASIQTLSARKYARLEMLMARHTFRIVVVDECFPPGTRVNGRPIERVRVGDMVSAFDPSTGRIVTRRVLRTFRKEAASLVSVRTSAGVMTCTPRHKIWTRRGWVRAYQLVTGDRIAHHAAADLHDLSRLPDICDAGHEGKDRYVAPIASDVLFSGTPRSMVPTTIVRADGRNESAVCVRQDAGAQSDAVPQVAGTDADLTAGDETQADPTGRQWAADSLGAGSVSLSVGMAGRSRGPNRGWLQAASLQTRHRQSNLENGDRGGRREPQLSGSAAAGSTQGDISTWAWVESVEVLESGSDGRFERLCPDGVVYDLEVEDLHTYFADGFAVSNCHHAAAATYRTVLARLGFLPKADESESGESEAATDQDVVLMAAALEGWDRVAPKDRLLLGVTATPNRTDAVGLGCVFQTIVYNYDLKTAIDRGRLVPIVPWVIETAESLDDVRITRGEFNQKDLAESVNTERRNALAVESWQVHAVDRSTIAFTVDVAHAHDLADQFRRSGVAAAAVSGETPKDERRDTLSSFTKGGLQVITNCMVLTEGTDLPRTSCILHAKPTKSATLYEQMTGRGLRTHPGKADCVVIDMVDIARKHSLQTAPVLYGLPPGLVSNGKDLEKVRQELEALREKYRAFDVDAMLAGGRFTIQELLDRASTFDVWAIPSLGAFGVGRAFNWIKTGPEVYRLQYPWNDGTEILEVSRDLLNQWQVVCTLRPNPDPVSGVLAPARQRTLAAGVMSSDEGAGLAEAFVLAQRGSVAKMKAPDAPWRSGGPSQKQLDLLVRWRVPHNPKTITKGEASDLLDLAASRRR